ncbi:uncharacterized protein Dwil_GK19913, partial [Drosophila willistoni]
MGNRLSGLWCKKTTTLNITNNDNEKQHQQQQRQQEQPFESSDKKQTYQRALEEDSSKLKPEMKVNAQLPIVKMTDFSDSSTNGVGVLSPASTLIENFHKKNHSNS